MYGGGTKNPLSSTSLGILDFCNIFMFYFPNFGMGTKKGKQKWSFKMKIEIMHVDFLHTKTDPFVVKKGIFEQRRGMLS